MSICFIKDDVDDGHEPHPVVKFREVTPTTPKVIAAHMWNFQPNFKCSRLKFFGPPIRFVACASKPWPVSSAFKNFRGQHWAPPIGRNIVSRKRRFGWVQTQMSNFLDSGPKFTGHVSPNAGGIVLDQLAFQFSISWVVAEILAIKVGSCVKSPQILHVFGLKFFYGSLPVIGLHYKIGADTDHVTTFHSERPTELGDLVAK